MRQYIGTKIIEAEPMSRGQGGKAEDGYKVRYPDGYESWSPKEVFERAYLKMTVNPHLKTDKPSISQEMVDDFIVASEVTTMGDKCTVVRAVLRNGFEIVESSACVSAENYDEKLGADICMEKIKDKVWFLLGFLLQTAVHGVDGGALPKMDAKEAEADLGETCGDPGWNYMSFGLAIEAMKKGKKVSRRGWNGKGMFLFLGTGIELHTEADLSCVSDLEGDLTLPTIVMKTADDKFCVGWLASQTDMLADDWEVVE